MKIRGLKSLLSAVLLLALSSVGGLSAAKGGTSPDIEVAANAPGVTSKLGDSLFFSFSDGKLLAQWKGDAKQAGQAQSVRRPTAKLVLRFGGTMKDATGESTFINVARQGVAGGGPGFFQLRIPRDAQPLSFNAHSLRTPDGEMFNLDLMPGVSGTRVIASRMVDLNSGRSSVTVLNAFAHDMRQLGAEHPDEVRRYVAPVLQELTGIDCFVPGAGDVYRAFPEIMPDSAVSAAFSGLLRNLDADDYTDRRQALIDLHAMGRLGVLVALRQDRRGLSPEQEAHLEALIASHTWQSIRSPDEAKHDAEFLVQCLSYEDPAVRSAAKKRLSELANRAVKFDSSLSGEALAGAIDQLRVDLLDVIYPGITIERNPPDPDETRAYVNQPMNAQQQRQQIQQMREWEGRLLANMKKGEQKYRLGDLIDFKRDNGIPQVKWTKKLMTNQPLRLDVEGRPGDWVLYRAGEQRKDNPDVMLTWSDPSRRGDEGPWKINLNFANEYMAVSAMYGEDAGVFSATINVVNNRVILIVSKDIGALPLIQVQGANLTELLQQQPEATRKYVFPMLRDLFGVYFEPPAAVDVYGVFDTIPANDVALSKLSQLLDRIDADLPSDRAAAAKELNDMGTPGVLAALRLPRENLTDEQIAELNTFLAVKGYRSSFDVVAARKDTAFLLACLACDDVAVRIAAKDALEKAIGSAIEFDPKLQAAARSTAIEAVRQKVEQMSTAKSPG